MRSSSVSVSVEKMPLIVTNLSIRVDPTSGVAPLNVHVECRLTRADTDAGINGEYVSLYINGTLFGTKMTTSIVIVPGYAVWDLTLQDPGTYEFYADYPGSSVYAGCEEEW